jgi:hypothetical protein
MIVSSKFHVASIDLVKAIFGHCIPSKDEFNQYLIVFRHVKNIINDNVKRSFKTINIFIQLNLTFFDTTEAVI